MNFLSFFETEVEVPVPAFIPENMVPDVQERLQWYRRLSSAQTPGAVDQVLEDLEMERGDLPPEVDNLAGLMILQLHGRELGLIRVAWLKVRAVIELHAASKAHAALDRMTTNMPKRFKVVPAADGVPTRLEVRFTPQEAERPYRFLRWVVSQLRR